MNLKTTKIIATINIFLLSFPSHFIYTIFPNTITSIFFPVNESIWEHMKILLTSTLIYGIIDYILLTKNKINISNFIPQLTITSILSIPIFLTLYLPTYKIIGENLIITIIIMLITYIIEQYISYLILISKPIKIPNYIYILTLILLYIIFTYLTYLPPKTPLFYDTLDNHYGIKRTYSKQISSFNL